MESEFSRLIDALPGLVWTALPDGRIDFLNQRWRDYTGLAAADASGDGWRAAIHPEDLPGLLETWTNLIASETVGEAVARMRGVNGDYRHFLVRASPVKDASGQLIRWCGINTDIEDLHRAEAALHAQEHRFREIVDGLPAMVNLMTPEGEFAHANGYMLDYFGVTLEAFRRQSADANYQQAFHQDDRAIAMSRWRESVQSGEPYDEEYRLRRADGVYRWFHARGFPLRDAEGRIVLWYLLQADVDDRRRAEDLLAGEKRLLEMVASGRPLPIVLDELCRVFEGLATDCTCSVVLVDAAGAHLLQGASPSLPAKFMASLDGRPIGLETGPCAMASYLNQQVIVADVEGETRWRAYGWPALALSYGLRAVWSTPITSVHGKVIGSFALHYHTPSTPTPQHQTLIDRFTHLASIAIERAQAEHQLRRSQACLAEAQTLSRTGSFGWSVSIDQHFWSDETFRILGYDASTPATIQRILDRAHPDDVWRVKEAMALGAEGRDFEYECRFVMPDGTLKHLHIVAHAARDEDGRLEYIGAVQDVSEQRLSEEALAKIRSDLAHVTRVMSLGALTASIAHEINQPLSGIITNASTCLRMLAADPPNVVGAQETARRTIRDGNRAADVITRLRALLGRKMVTTEPVDLNAATREILALAERELRRSQVILLTDLAADLPAAAGDHVQLQQVILNLLLNAAEAMSEVEDRPRQLKVQTRCDESDRVRLTVEDLGVGFDVDDAERLFEAFYTTKPKGMGIGLSVSRSIIESHRGRLWATPNEGPGATFSFSIPRVAEGVTVASHPGAVRAPAEADAGLVERIF